MPGLNVLSRWLLFGEWRAHPVRALLAVAAIAVGVAMGFAIHLINAAAFNEFSAAIKSLSGQADVQVAGREAWFDEADLSAPGRSTEGWRVASPVLLVKAGVPAHAARCGSSASTPSAPAPSRPTCSASSATGSLTDMLADDAIFLSPGGGRAGCKPGRRRRSRCASGTRDFRCAWPAPCRRRGPASASP